MIESNGFGFVDGIVQISARPVSIRIDTGNTMKVANSPNYRAHRIGWSLIYKERARAVSEELSASRGNEQYVDQVGQPDVAARAPGGSRC
jgi:hypothetical protein